MSTVRLISPAKRLNTSLETGFKRRLLGFLGMWEVPSGSAAVGEESLTATIRETREESGIILLPENAELYIDSEGYIMDLLVIKHGQSNQEGEAPNISAKRDSMRGKVKRCKVITYKKVDRSYFPQYDLIPMRVHVSSYYRIDKINRGLGGFHFIETPVEPYIKDFCTGDDESIMRWEKRWDISNWAFFMAFDDDRPVGARFFQIGLMMV